jgi:hypothetical protein
MEKRGVGTDHRPGRDNPGWTPDTLLMEVRRVSKRARVLKGRPWISLAAFSTVMFLGVDVLALAPSGITVVLCSSSPQLGALRPHCGPKAVGAARVLSVHRSPPAHVLTVVQQASVALALGYQWWFWSAAVVLVIAAIAARQLIVARRHIRDLRWYSLAIAGALVGQEVTGHTGWAPNTAGMFAIGCGLVILAARDRQALVLACGGIVLALSSYLRNSPVTVTATRLPTILPVSSVAQICIGFSLAALAVAMRRQIYSRSMECNENETAFDDI